MHGWMTGLAMFALGTLCYGATSATPTKAPASDQAPLKPECKAMRWRGSFEKELMQDQFASIPRATLIQIAWGELLSEPAHSAAPVILFYLYATEHHGPLKRYFESLASEVGNQKFTMRGLVARYPIRNGNSKVSRSTEKMCAEYDVAYLERDADVVREWSGGPKL